MVVTCSSGVSKTIVIVTYDNRTANTSTTYDSCTLFGMGYNAANRQVHQLMYNDYEYYTGTTATYICKYNLTNAFGHVLYWQRYDD